MGGTELPSSVGARVPQGHERRRFGGFCRGGGGEIPEKWEALIHPIGGHYEGFSECWPTSNRGSAEKDGDPGRHHRALDASGSRRVASPIFSWRTVGRLIRHLSGDHVCRPITVVSSADRMSPGRARQPLQVLGMDRHVMVLVGKGGGEGLGYHPWGREQPEDSATSLL